MENWHTQTQTLEPEKREDKTARSSTYTYGKYVLYVWFFFAHRFYHIQLGPIYSMYMYMFCTFLHSRNQQLSLDGVVMVVMEVVVF